MRAIRSSSWKTDPTPAQQTTIAQTAATTFIAAPTSANAQALIVLLEALFAD